MQLVTVDLRFNDPWPRLRVTQQLPTRAEECSTVVNQIFISASVECSHQLATVRMQTNMSSWEAKN
jgi:hypothetical protein